ncbi:hypothetical protein JHK87_043158 [Glycine soja]|nr:hypothetical protein JHK87_043158 [Glycine soja]
MKLHLAGIPGDDNLDTMEFQVDSGDVGGSTTSTNEDVIPIMSKFDGINLNDYYMSCDTLLSSRRTPYPVKLGFEERIDQAYSKFLGILRKHYESPENYFPTKHGGS